VKGYLSAIWPTLQTASPVTVLIILALWTASIWWFTSELRRAHTVNQALWGQLMAAQKAQVDLAWRCYQTEPRHE
jgi:hypothetical protein